MDSGHPPFFGMGLAALWKLFGRELWVGHLYMFPFLVGILFFLQRLGKYYLEKSKSWWLILLVFVDPVFAGQCVLVTPDIALVAFFLWAWWSILKDKNVHLGIAAIGMAMISTRGMMIVFALFLFQVLRDWQFNKVKIIFPHLIKRITPFVPSGLLACAFLGAHYAHTGWIGYHEDSPWAASFERVDAAGFLKNIGLLGWRMLDFGRVFLWVIALGILLKSFWTKRGWSSSVRELLLLGLMLIVITTPSMLLHRHLSAHRYLLPIMLVVDALTLVLIYQSITQTRWKYFLYSLVVLALMTGNLWVYPKTVAQGWDATLAHLPYYSLRNQMMDYIDEQGIPYEIIGTDFPNYAERNIIDLIDDPRRLAQKDLDTNIYIMYSTVYNNFTDEELIELENRWTIERRFSTGSIEVILYKK